jgi:16S rRNA (cytosine967-C5)-methyltransferase
MGVLRWRSRLDEDIAHFSTQKFANLDREVVTTLRMGAYQLLFLDRIPARAAVHESVELVKRARKRSAAPFVNALLRKLATGGREQRKQAAITSATDARELSQSSAHPLWLVERWISEFGLQASRQICEYDQQAPDTALHLGQSAVEGELKAAGVELAPGRLLRSARRILSGNFQDTRAFRDGRVAVQDEASQLVALLVGKGQRILDCCAAPGGKTRILAEQNPHVKIVAVELHPHRARLLRKLVPAPNVEVVAADIRELPVSTHFDRVLVDVPCSGTGTLARNPEIKWRLKPEDLMDLHERQLAILQAAMRQVAPGGRLVYSTCSLEREENQEVVDRALAANASFRRLDCRTELERLREEGELVWCDLDSITTGPYLRTIPGVHLCDGFFAAILEKL